MKIEENTTWLYVGPQHGKNMEHRVIMRRKDEVITWSVCDKWCEFDKANGGFSWLGNDADFLKNFKPAVAT
jgi:hypothetical protein